MTKQFYKKKRKKKRKKSCKKGDNVKEGGNMKQF